MFRELLIDWYFDWRYYESGAAEWHPWFAWRRVYLSDKKVRVRWQRVERRLRGEQENYWWEYRERYSNWDA